MRPAPCTEGLVICVQQKAPVERKVVICDCGAILPTDARGAVSPIPEHTPRPC